MIPLSKILNKPVVLLGAILLLNSCYKEAQLIDYEPNKFGYHVLKINDSYGFTDLTDNIILYTIGADIIAGFTPDIQFENYTSISFNGKELQNKQANQLGDVRINFPYDIIAKREGVIDSFQLYFTRIPLLQIHTEEVIRDEPKVLAWLSLQYNQDVENPSSSHTFYSYAGIEIRGASSQVYDKKSFGIELWEDKLGDNNKIPLLGMADNEDWILDAMYIDDLRMRNKLSFELWEKLNNVPVADHKPEVIPGMRCEYVELFINNRYFGIYSLGEKIDESKLHYSDSQDMIGGVLYKANNWSDGATKFYSYNTSPPDDVNWDGWEQIYPSDIYAWDPLDQLRQLIVLGEDEEFKNEIPSLFDIDNAVDYYLFINLLLAADNSGKNTFLARYSDQSTFFYIPWDIESSWGFILGQNKKVEPKNLTSNNLFMRLQETNAGNFNEKMEARWFDLRTDIFSETALHQSIDEYYYSLKKNGVIDRENGRWGEYIIDLDEEHEFIKEWISQRLQYLDEHFE